MLAALMRWLPEWRQPGTVCAERLAGLTGAVVVPPQAMAFATLGRACCWWWPAVDRLERNRSPRRKEKVERLPLAVTLLGTVSLPLEWAILLGITSALIARRLLRPA